MSDEVERVELPMACTCAPDDAARMHALRASVKRRLAAGSATLLPSLVTDENFLSALATSLRADLRAHITDIYLDQWFLVSVEQRIDDGRTRQLVVQADEAEDGLAALWDYLDAETYRPGDGSPVG
jgi:hypothetical protein